MKTLCRFFTATMLFFLLCITSLSAQAPQKFNYQAVVRNTGGTVIASQAIRVRASIIKDSPTGTTVYTETHTPTTTSLGMVTLAIGGGTSGDDFSAIDWGSGDHYLRIEVDPAGGTSYQTLGTPQLLSVPYALYSGTGAGQWTVGSGDTILYRLEGNVGVGTSLPAGKLEVKGDGDETDSTALFEVKRSDGQSVFAVYPGGVEVFVDDDAKGAKGGFAIGGFSSLSKGITNEFMRVTPDSVRIYIDPASAKGAKGGFAIGGIGNKKGPLNDFMRITPENYFIGQESGASITDGRYNSFMGFQSGTSTTIGDANIFLGYQSGFANISGFSNTFIGNTAGYENETGTANVFIGDSSGFNNDADWNVFIGRNAGYNNTTGEANIVIGDYAGYFNTEGQYNVFLGDLAGYYSSTGSSNVFIGSSAGIWNEEGSYNVFLGESAGYNNSLGSSNVFLGESAGYENTIGESNVFLGTEAGNRNTEGINNVFMGTSSGFSNTTGNYNVFMGDESGFTSDTGRSNVFIGLRSGYSNIGGHFNVFLGTWSGKDNETGQQNVYLGQQAGQSNVDGNYNVSIGSLSGQNHGGNNNTFVGYAAGYAYSQTDLDGSNNIFIGNGAGYFGTGWSGRTSNMFIVDNDYSTWDNSFMYGEMDAHYLYINSDVYVEGDFNYYDSWLTSDEKFKQNVQTYDNALNQIRSLRGVTYEWNGEIRKGESLPEGRQIGLIAQEVEQVIPELVKTDRDGDKAINYTKLTAVLIEAMKEQQKMIEDLQKEVAELKAGR